jgi:4-amino-4-deoxy-L-arabinose transferase-like glycosyltransferase
MRFSKSLLVVLLLMLAAFALRVYRLDFFSLRGDESFTVLFVQKPLAQMWEETLTVEPNPPLLYFALRGWIDLAGDSEFVTRFFSVFFGVLCIPLVYRAAREMFAVLEQTVR